MDTDIVNNICVPWLQRPYIDPITGNSISPKKYKETVETCQQLINFDLLRLTDIEDKDYFKVSPIVSFLTAAYISQIAKNNFIHPMKKQYQPSTTITSSLLDNFDFGFIWHYNNAKWQLIPPMDLHLDHSVLRYQIVLISIVHPEYIGCNILLYDAVIHGWERFSPIGIQQYNSRDLDEALLAYIKTVGPKRMGNYYTTMNCPIVQRDDISEVERELFCSVWDLWFLLYRVMQSKATARETQYNRALGHVMTHTDQFNEFLSDYISFIKKHKDNIDLLTIPTKDIDDILTERIFSLF